MNRPTCHPLQSARVGCGSYRADERQRRMSWNVLQRLFAATLVAVGSPASASGFAIVTAKGYVRFAVPDDWHLLAMQSKPPVSVVAFQIVNPADEGTPHSTNVAISLFHVETEQGRAAVASVGHQYGVEPPSVRSQDGWSIYTQEAMQRGALYTVIDASKPFADVVVGVRFAWPHLPANAPGYADSMNEAFASLRRSVGSGWGVPEPGIDGVVLRPTQ